MSDLTEAQVASLEEWVRLYVPECIADHRMVSYVEHLRSELRDRNRSIAQLRDALERTARNLDLIIQRKPVRDLAETFGEAERAMRETA